MRTARSLLATAASAALLFTSAAPALADHTDPKPPLATTDDPGTTELLTEGAGTWKFIRNFPANPGTDLRFFKKRGRLYASGGTLGQADEQHVGQRIIRLVNKRGRVRPKWIADHGSANCPTANPSGTTGLQHDVTLGPFKNPKFLIDATDASGRCHDPGGGGLEIVDISKIHKRKFKPREIHLTRHSGTSHNSTVDVKRPWIVYNSSSQATAMPWIDVLNIKSCLKKGLKGLKAKRAACRPKVYRIYFKDKWARRIDTSGETVPTTESACHDIHSTRNRIYCANANSTIVLNVRRLTRKNGSIRGTPLKCEVVDGTLTSAKVTDCSNLEEVGNGQARGWSYFGHVNHPGRNGSHNTNTDVESTEGVAVSHEAEPTPNKRFMFVTDERGGGVVPGGSSCTAAPNPYGNGGVHVFKIGGGGEFEYAKAPDGSKAVFIGDVLVPSGTFCTAHVMEQIPREQRFVIAWYSQGTKIVDWFVKNGRWTFRETASVVPQGPNANTWTTEVFKIVKRKNGRRTYYFMATDITRGIDIFSWTGRPHKKTPVTSPVPTPAKRGDKAPAEAPAEAVVLGALGLAVAGPILRRRMRLPIDLV